MTYTAVIDSQKDLTPSVQGSPAQGPPEVSKAVRKPAQLECLPNTGQASVPSSSGAHCI